MKIPFQDIVYKLVPDMQREEQKRRELFNQEHPPELENGDSGSRESEEKECEKPGETVGTELFCPLRVYIP